MLPSIAKMHLLPALGCVRMPCLLCKLRRQTTASLSSRPCRPRILLQTRDINYRATNICLFLML